MRANAVFALNLRSPVQ